MTIPTKIKSQKLTKHRPQDAHTIKLECVTAKDIKSAQSSPKNCVHSIYPRVSHPLDRSWVFRCGVSAYRVRIRRVINKFGLAPPPSLSRTGAPQNLLFNLSRVRFFKSPNFRKPDESTRSLSTPSRERSSRAWVNLIRLKIHGVGEPFIVKHANIPARSRVSVRQNYSTNQPGK